jgi:hypothetical protein
MNWKLFCFSKCFYVNVTSLCFYAGWKLFSKCLCECYIWMKVGNMWMLHSIIVRLSKCSHECCIYGINLKIHDSSQNVYVNVTSMILTWKFSILLKMFMWMLHLWYHNEGWKFFSKCSCECYICGVNLKLEDSHVKITYYCQILKMFMWMLHIIVNSQKV